MCKILNLRDTIISLNQGDECCERVWNGFRKRERESFFSRAKFHHVGGAGVGFIIAFGPFQPMNKHIHPSGWRYHSFCSTPATLISMPRLCEYECPFGQSHWISMNTPNNIHMMSLCLLRKIWFMCRQTRNVLLFRHIHFGLAHTHTHTHVLFISLKRINAQSIQYVLHELINLLVLPPVEFGIYAVEFFALDSFRVANKLLPIRFRSAIRFNVCCFALLEIQLVDS